MHIAYTMAIETRFPRDQEAEADGHRRHPGGVQFGFAGDLAPHRAELAEFAFDPGPFGKLSLGKVVFNSSQFDSVFVFQSVYLPKGNNCKLYTS